MLKVAFGPATKLPSFDWVGRDIALELDKKEGVSASIFSSFTKQLDADVLFVIKSPPPLHWMLAQKKRGKKLIYMPVDQFTKPSTIVKNKIILSLFDAIYLHTESIKDLISQYNPNIFYIDHYLKYQLPGKRTFKQEGQILWVGHLEYLAELLKRVHELKLKPDELLILANLTRWDKKSDSIKRKLGSYGIPFSATKINDTTIEICGYTIEQWTEARQQKYLDECKAAFDTKEDSFKHMIKPPTKGQKYVLNGIPFAADPHTYTVKYFSNLGLTVPPPEEKGEWLSRDYFDRTQAFQEEHQKAFSKAAIAESYMADLDKINVNPPNANRVALYALNVSSKIKSIWVKYT